MEIEIKNAEIKDLDEIIALNQKLFDHEFENFDKTLDCTWSSKNKSYFEERITEKDSIVLVAFVNNKIVGYLIGAINKSEEYRKIRRFAELESIIILEEFRSKGIGRILCERFLEWTKEKNAKIARIIVTAQNQKAREFYQKLGFFEYHIALEKEI